MSAVRQAREAFKHFSWRTSWVFEPFAWKMELNEYEWANKQENFVKFSGVVDGKRGPTLDNSGASMLHMTGAKGVFFYERVGIDGAHGLLVQLASVPVPEAFYSSIGTFTFIGFK